MLKTKTTPAVPVQRNPNIPATELRMSTAAPTKITTMMTMTMAKSPANPSRQVRQADPQATPTQKSCPQAHTTAPNTIAFLQVI